MRRIVIALLLGLASVSAVACGGGQPALPPIPEVDTRDPEIKEADDFMGQQAAKSVKSRGKARRP